MVLEAYLVAIVLLVKSQELQFGLDIQVPQDQTFGLWLARIDVNEWTVSKKTNIPVTITPQAAGNLTTPKGTLREWVCERVRINYHGLTSEWEQGRYTNGP